MTLWYAGWNSTGIDKYKHTKKRCAQSWFYLQDCSDLILSDILDTVHYLRIYGP